MRFVDEAPTDESKSALLESSHGRREIGRSWFDPAAATWTDSAGAVVDASQPIGPDQKWSTLVRFDPDLTVGRDVSVTVAWRGPLVCPLRVSQVESSAATPAEVQERIHRAARPLKGRIVTLDDEHRTVQHYRLGSHTRQLLMVVEATEEPVTVTSVEVRELCGTDRLKLSRGDLNHEVGSVAGRFRVGPYVQDALLLPTPSSVGFEVPATSDDAVLAFSYGVAREETGRGDADVTYRVTLLSGESERVLFEDTVESARELTARGPRYAKVSCGPLAEGARIRFETSVTGPALNEDPLVLATIGHPVLRAGEQSDEPGMIVLSIDTLRADRVGCYGLYDGRSLTPTVDRLAESSCRFEHATAHASFTLPSHASVFSGQYPTVHGMTRPGFHRDPGVTQWMAEIARSKGMRTAAFTGGGQLGATMGIDGGFEAYHFRDSIIRGAFEEIEEWLDHAGDERSLLFLHTYAAHHYEPPREILDEIHPHCESKLHELDSLRDVVALARDQNMSEVDKQHITAVYDAAVLFADRQVGILVEKLERRGLLDDNYLIILSDHGEELFDHDQVGHGFRPPYQEQVHVPLIIRPPGGFEEPRVSSRIVELIDVFPTALNLLGLHPSLLSNGETLVGDLGGHPTADGFAYIESTSGKFAALRAIGWKAVLRRLPGKPDEIFVFDLVHDPGEQTPIVDADHPSFEVARSKFVHTSKAVRKLVEQLNADIRSKALSPQELEELIRLGYMDLITNIDPPESEKGPDESDSSD